MHGKMIIDTDYNSKFEICKNEYFDAKLRYTF